MHRKTGNISFLGFFIFPHLSIAKFWTPETGVQRVQEHHLLYFFGSIGENAVKEAFFCKSL